MNVFCLELVRVNQTADGVSTPVPSILYGGEAENGKEVVIPSMAGSWR